ncbi:ribosomal protection-like ABC-F family protein [Arenimonas sp.]|uniref:ribosomal protection-like ABC-F family protein n=1 Tax=Arenimonas sp. TaxID=1872635 RepID=UPI002E35216E|nr:ATP-binding cassette domain-containing protein [Arenimonas sp.]HEX4853686.1 ATP-binding cassette domain-containing protein [Arenimonas sp.]
MSLITFQGVDYSVGGPLLLESVNLTIERNERVCIVGRNGAGKSTLLRLMGGAITPDDGVVKREGRLAGLAQEVPKDLAGSVFDVVAMGLGALGADLARYHHMLHDGADIDMDELGAVQARIEAGDGWQIEQRVEQVISKLDLPEDAEFSALSGGMKRRVLLAQALVAAPDLLLLDEPTNHLDIESIAWLEEFLKNFGGSVVFVTHDREFLKNLATRIVEIDRGQVTSWPGDYDNFLRRREERLHAEAQANALFDKKLAQEEVWIRQGIKARRTRNEGRVTALKAMRRERAERREQQGNVKLAAAGAEKSGRKVFEAKDISFAFDGEGGAQGPGRAGTARVLVRNFSTVIQRGDKIGLIGPNGSGKTTLLKLLLGDLQPQSGEVRVGTNLEVAFFDQLRAALREDWNALDNVSEGREFIEINGSRKHVMGYLQDFLFSPDRALAPITKLSGGERNRLLLAKLFAKPSNVLVMDEPTNDLDVETLELLEELLIDYPGTLILVSHDRAFLDNVVTSSLVMEGNGRVGEYVGGYTDWLRQRPMSARIAAANAASPRLTPQVAPTPKPAAAPAAPAPAKRKLSYKEQRELEELPGRIETLDADIAALTAQIQDPAFYRQPADAVTAANARLSSLQAELEQAYARWNELE